MPSQRRSPLQARKCSLPGLLTRLLPVLALALAGCQGSNIRIESSQTPYFLAPDIYRAVYTYRDENEVDVYLTDLDPEDLRRLPDGSYPTPPPGQITHIHLFLRPWPGRTPIDPTAANTTVRHAVFAPAAQVGVYAGGGFLLPRSTAESGRFDARMINATLVLRQASERFDDRLGPVRMRGTIRANHDERTARILAAALEASLARTREIEAGTDADE